MSERARRASAGRRPTNSGRPATSRSRSGRAKKSQQDVIKNLHAVRDSYNNLIAKLGSNEANALSSSYYFPQGISAHWEQLTIMYREGWLTKKIIDIPSEDMTKSWISFDTQLEQDAVRAIEREMRQFRVQKKMTDGIRWGRLYGGAIGIILIAGEEDMMDRPLDLVLVMPGTFRGLIIKDRWDDVSPSMELVTDMMDPDFGYPKYYEIGDLKPDENGSSSSSTIKVHHSRVVRFIGRELPHRDEEAEQYWGASEMEHVFDELNKRNATSANIAQLVFQANLRVMKMGDLGQLLAMSDERTQQELYATIQAQNLLMTSFGIQVMDAKDSFETHPYSFAGLNDIYQSFQSDISGAAEIPATKLFGKSPDGMNATGESDLTNYYDSIRQKQENDLRPALEKLLPIVCVSALGAVPDDIDIVFEPVESTTDAQRASLAQQVVGSVTSLFQADLYSKPMALNELRKSAYVTGIGSVITDEDIEKAEEEAELMAEQNAMGGGMGMMGGVPGMPGAEGMQGQEQGGPAPGQANQPQAPQQAGAGKQPFPKAPGAGELTEAEDSDDEKSVAIQGIRAKLNQVEQLRNMIYSQDALDAFDPNQKRDEDGKWTSD